MGKIIELKNKIIIPTQYGGLNEENIGKVLESWLENPKNILIAVKENPENEKEELILDGHHKSSIVELFSKCRNYEIYGWLAKNKEDFLDEIPKEFFQHSGLLKEMNRNIYERFDKVQKISKYPDLKSLRNDFSFMESPISLMKHYYIPKRCE